MSRVWVVVTTYNEEDTVKEVVDSVLAQDLMPERVLCVDDGSTDRTISILEEYGPQVQVVTKAVKRRGVMDSIETGTRIAMDGGADVAVVVSGHVVVPVGWVSGVLRVLKHYPESGIIQGPIEQKYSVLKERLTWYQRRTMEPPPWAHYQKREEIGGAPPQPSLVAYATTALGALGKSIFCAEAASEDIIMQRLVSAGYTYTYITDLPAGQHVVTRYGTPWSGLKYTYRLVYYLPVHIRACTQVGLDEDEARERRGLILGKFRPLVPDQVATLLLLILLAAGGWVSVVAGAALVLRGITRTKTRRPLRYRAAYFWYFILHDLAELAGGVAGSLKARRLAL